MSSATIDTERKEPTPVTIFYHRNCSDGFGAAWAAWKRYSGRLPLSFVPYNYGDPLPEIPVGQDVFILDLSFDPVYLALLRNRAHHVVLLDHHKSAM